MTVARSKRVVRTHHYVNTYGVPSQGKGTPNGPRALAEFLALDMIPQAYRPTPRQRKHRRLVRHRHYLRGRITSIKNRLRNILADYNADRPDLFTRAGLEYMRELALLTAERFVLEGLLKELSLYFEQINAIERQLREFAQTAPSPEAAARKLLSTIPGVGPVTIEVFLSEIADLRRFSSQKKVVACAGLAPGQRESGGRRRELGISHAGSGMLRWVLNQASWQLVRRSEHWRRIFEAIAKRRGRKKAITAISRRLLCVMTSRLCLGACPSATPDRVNGGIRWIFSWAVGYAMIPNRSLSVTRHVGLRSSKPPEGAQLPPPRAQVTRSASSGQACGRWPGPSHRRRLRWAGSTDADGDGNVRKHLPQNPCTERLTTPAS